MYFTDRGIEGARRGEDQVTLGWLAARLQGSRMITQIPQQRWPVRWAPPGQART
ncbi:MAG: DUF6104 family protein, partial [Streptosporangiaceae bacterium]